MLIKINRQKHLKAQFLRKVKVKIIKADVKYKTPDILPEKITPESPKNIFGNKHNIAFRLKKIAP